MPLRRWEVHAVTCALLLFGTGQAALPWAFAQAPPDAGQVATRALDHAIIIDTHADTPQAFLEEGYDLASPASPFMISIPKMRSGHLGAEFFSIWVDVTWPKEDLIHRALDLIDVTDQQVARHSDVLGLAGTADDVERLHREGKIAILMGLEGGHQIEGDLHMLDIFYRLGVRYMTLTHTKNDELGDSSGDKPGWKGLSPLGRQAIERMNQVGMMVDISHVSDNTFYDALAVSKAPLIASHSSCRALCSAPRNMTDDMIRALAKNGGVMDINFYSGFLSQAFQDGYRKIEKQVEDELAAARARYAEQGKRLPYLEEVRIQQRLIKDLPAPSYTAIADHIDHAVKVGGIDHVGLGSDFDGIDSAPRGMEDVSKIPDLVLELARRGYSEGDLEKILGGNILRVMRQVEAVSRRLQK
ncbi:MAG TPA: dipeptidase [Terriglobia bacterium]|nr:dipeptidase [Terriglobia bacterium]